MMDARKIDRSELAMWAVGTPYTTDELASMYDDYCTVEREDGREPKDEGDWAESVCGIANEPTETTQHTPTPWKRCGGTTRDYIAVFSPAANKYVVYSMGYLGEDPVATRLLPTDEEAMANGDLIVRAVNAFEPMREALEAYIKRHNHVALDVVCDCELCNAARAALKLAESK